MPQRLALGEGSLNGTKPNKKDHHTGSMHPKSLSGSVSSLPDRLENNDSRSHPSIESRKSCSCEHITSLTPCEHDDCICEICGESLETRFGKMDGHKMASFYKLWDRPSRQDVVSRSLERPRSLERADKYRDCGCYTRTYLRKEQKWCTKPNSLHWRPDYKLSVRKWPWTCAMDKMLILSIIKCQYFSYHLCG